MGFPVRRARLRARAISWLSLRSRMCHSPFWRLVLLLAFPLLLRLPDGSAVLQDVPHGSLDYRRLALAPLRRSDPQPPRQVLIEVESHEFLACRDVPACRHVTTPPPPPGVRSPGSTR